MKLYMIWSGYYSSMDGNEGLIAICSSKERALEIIKKETSSYRLKQNKHRTTGELLDSWSDGDYHVYISDGYLDSECYCASQEEVNSWSNS